MSDQRVKDMQQSYLDYLDDAVDKARELASEGLRVAAGFVLGSAAALAQQAADDLERTGHSHLADELRDEIVRVEGLAQGMVEGEVWEAR
ncbi:MAG: hypothetical protein U5L04_02430 [Trueperaceae bacterium]|nr:hypothetical protein [Trueperaceae bacterium]